MSRSKNPLDQLQGMVNGILIETGRALRGSDKEGGRTLANAGSRLRSTIPPAIESFQQALDDLESEIVRAKAVLLRDLEEIRSKRYALENPPVQVVEPEREPSIEVMPSGNDIKEYDQPSPMIKQERMDVQEASSVAEDPAKESIAKVPEDLKGVSGLSPPNSNEVEVEAKRDEATLGTTLTGASANADLLTSATGIQDSIDALFDAQDGGDNNADLNFDGMEFLDDSGTQNASQMQNNDFDLASFGNNPQDFNMAGLQGSNGLQNTTNNTGNAEEDLFGMPNASAGGDMMDLDANTGLADENANIRPAEESSFDEMYFFGDDSAINGGTEMEHGDFDDAFFGLDKE